MVRHLESLLSDGILVPQIEKGRILDPGLQIRNATQLAVSYCHLILTSQRIL